MRIIRLYLSSPLVTDPFPPVGNTKLSANVNSQNPLSLPEQQKCISIKRRSTERLCKLLKVTQQLELETARVSDPETFSAFFSSSCPLVSFLSSQLPLGKIGRGFSSKDSDFHDDYGSLQNEDCGDDDPQGRPEQRRLEGYNSLEVTNV